MTSKILRILVGSVYFHLKEKWMNLSKNTSTHRIMFLINNLNKHSFIKLNKHISPSGINYNYIVFLINFLKNYKAWFTSYLKHIHPIFSYPSCSHIITNTHELFNLYHIFPCLAPWCMAPWRLREDRSRGRVRSMAIRTWALCLAP